MTVLVDIKAVAVLQCTGYEDQESRYPLEANNARASFFATSGILAPSIIIFSSPRVGRGTWALTGDQAVRHSGGR